MNAPHTHHSNESPAGHPIEPPPRPPARAKGGGWPIVVIVAAAVLLPLTIFLVPMGGGEAQFEQLFSESTPERAQALDYWSTTFRGSPPRLYDSTIVAERLDDRMRLARPEAVLDFHRHFRQDPDYVRVFRPTYLRGTLLTLGQDPSPDARARVLADMLTLLRQERSELQTTGPRLNTQDRERVARFFDEYAAAMNNAPRTDADGREAEARSVLAAAMLVSPETARRAGAAMGFAELGEQAAGDAPQALPRAL